MGKHNGKARKLGITVGSALVNRAKREGRAGTASAYLHTTEPVDKGPNMQSVIESNDLDEMMEMATLANKDFTAEKQQVIVISTGAVPHVDSERAAAARKEAEDRNRHRLRIPCRPAWTPAMSPEELDNQERSAFYDWRRDLAALEGDEALVLTPFEKNLEVWRQLWRVLERSDVVVQVVDARDPLTYRSEDLERYALTLHPTKRSLLLLNKADLLPEALRSAWADFFDARGLHYLFWSAKAAVEALTADEDDVPRVPRECKDPRARVLSGPELQGILEGEARRATADAEAAGVPRTSRGERVVVGLTGYPNVGKSSTINAIFGSKKTAVAPTPGKTKHFQTLNVSDGLCLCDCPGLVMPQYAQSKAEMVAAGVIPIDRLTDVRAPLETVVQRISRQQLEGVYGIKLPAPLPSEEQGRPPTAAELIRAFAISRNWVASSGLPDETRCGRKLLKDYVDGKILYCKGPPGAGPEVQALVAALSGHFRGGAGVHELIAPLPAAAAAAAPAAAAQGGAGAGEAAAVPSGEAAPGPDLEGEEGAAPGTSGAVGYLDTADYDLMEALGISEGKPKKVRPEYKFHKKAARSKGDRGKAAGKDEAGTGPIDGAALVIGKRGGMVRAAG